MSTTSKPITLHATTPTRPSAMTTPSRLRTQQHKLVLLGESAVGKSSLVMQYVKQSFSTNIESTIGAAFCTVNVELSDKVIKYEIWDTAGQERYSALAPMYFRGASAAIVVYDITAAHTFDRAKHWVTELRRQSPDGSVVIALCGNKLDLLQNNAKQRQIQFDVAKQYAADNGLLFFETSAKTAHSVQELFYTLATKLPIPAPKAAGSNKNVALNGGGSNSNASAGGGCCT